MGINNHPVFGNYDRLFFNKDGFIVPMAFSIDEHGNNIRLTNDSLEIDNEKARELIGNKNDTLFILWDGSSSFGPYHAYVEDGWDYSSSELADVQQSIFFLCSRIVDKKLQFIGGVSAMVADKQNVWQAVSETTFKAFTEWCQDKFTSKNIVSDAMTTWLEMVKKCAAIRLPMKAEDLLVDAHAFQMRAQSKGTAVAVIKDQGVLSFVPDKTFEGPPKPEIEAEPKPLPCRGNIHQIDIPATAYIEKVE